MSELVFAWHASPPRRPLHSCIHAQGPLRLFRRPPFFFLRSTGPVRSIRLLSRATRSTFVTVN